jgi:hypothetical protein
MRPLGKTARKNYITTGAAAENHLVRTL